MVVGRRGASADHFLAPRLLPPESEVCQSLRVCRRVEPSNRGASPDAFGYRVFEGRHLDRLCSDFLCEMGGDDHDALVIADDNVTRPDRSLSACKVASRSRGLRSDAQGLTAYNCMQIRSWFSLRRFVTLALSLAGVGVFWLLDLPLPFLLGPMFACLVAALSGAGLVGTPKLSEGMRPVLGVAVGASLTPELVGRVDEMALSVALILPFILLIGVTGYPYFRRLWGFDKATSYYAAMPGGLQDMIMFGEQAGADARALSLIHTTRVLIIVSLMPFLLRLIWDLPLTDPPGVPAASVPFREYFVMLVCAVIGWWGGARIGLFGAPILGPLIVAGIASLTDLLHGRPPAEMMLFAQFFLGLGIGVKYVGITVEEIRRILTASAGYCLMLAVLSVIFAEIVIQAGLAAPLEAVLAFAPGGQAEMVLLAIIAGADMAYVVTHHMIRVIVVILGAPIAVRLLK